jgi:uncharacterized protein YhaN
VRLVRLDLVAFGPFTDRSLDFSGGAPGGLHVVYGKNAAGKSTALRAISDLLFGIPAKSNDDHVHSYQKLRVRATLANGSGEEIVVQRLKRNKDALRDANDAPLDELVLKRLLGNVDRKMFERVFGLDHERLREAGQALLEGGGDVGESLFDAGAGGHGVRRVLEKLRAEAERLYKPRGKQEINQLLERYRLARERVSQALHPPDLYVEQEQRLRERLEERERVAEELRRLREERERKLLLQGSLKGIARRDRLRAELAELGPVPNLPEDVSERRERAEHALASEAVNQARVEREIARLEERRAELVIPEGLLSVGEVAMSTLRDGIGRTKKALLDLPVREAELAERRAEAALVERRLGQSYNDESLVERRAEEARFRELAAQRGVSEERLRAAAERARQAELDHDTQKARLGALPAPAAVDALERAVLLARRVGDVDAARVELGRERAELSARVLAELSKLAPWAGNLRELAALRVPALETVERFERGLFELAERARRLEAREERCRARMEELSREIAAEEQAGPVPSEEELERARKSRDERFDILCKELPARGRSSEPLFEAARIRDYRAAVGAADLLADRLRREAARVAEQARRLTEHGQLLEEKARLAALAAELASDSEKLERDWVSAWSEAGFEPLRPAEMRSWLSRREQAAALLIEEASLNEREAELERQTRALTRALAEALGGTPETPLAVSVERANERLDAERALAAQRAALAQQVAELEVRRDKARRDFEREERAAEELARELAEATVALGFDAKLAPEEVESRLEARAELSRVRAQTSELERRVAGMRRDIQAFEAEVAELVRAHAPELAELPSERAAVEVIARFERGRRDAEVIERLEQELAERRRELARHRELAESAERELAELVALAGVPDRAALPELELRVKKARALSADLELLEGTLGEAAGARGLEALVLEARGTDPARLSVEIDELEQRIEELNQTYEGIIHAISSLQAGLSRMGEASAAQAAEEEQEFMAALVAKSERWARFKLAEVLLAREIERYREQHQGPVLRRAGELFARLTQEEYRGLRVGREERAIVAVRRNELEVSVDGLNEAARYHLYLALRLASLERYLEHGEPLPLVLDDVLIHFDEEGARAALEVFGDLSRKMQVLLFTHHRHNVALAERAVARDRLFIHEL